MADTGGVKYSARMTPVKKLGLILCAMIALDGCGAGSSLESRHETARGIARPAMMDERVVAAGIFNLTLWVRLNKPDAPAHVYIEGDGLAWLSKHLKSMNPTPPDPMTLRLAALDSADNVIYMARPCQYTGWHKPDACPDLYWTNGRTAPEVIHAYQQALDNMKARATGFHLIGYSGGAAVAALVAAGRNDVLSLRTVAGNLDYATFSHLHKISPLDASLDPIRIAASIAHIPQFHFIGEQDKVVPAAIFDSWKRASGITACVQSAIVADSTHEKGWIEKWQDLLFSPLPPCGKGAQERAP